MLRPLTNPNYCVIFPPVPQRRQLRLRRSTQNALYLGVFRGLRKLRKTIYTLCFLVKFNVIQFIPVCIAVLADHMI